MRDSSRIPILLSSLQEIWKKHPDWRLMQLLINVIQPAEPMPALFYLEDEKLLALVEKILKSNDWPG